MILFGHMDLQFQIFNNVLISEYKLRKHIESVTT
jgi:hypothetical protein